MLCLSFLLAPACSQVKPSQGTKTNLRAQIKLKIEKGIKRVCNIFRWFLI